MKILRNDQSGFSGIEIILTVAVIGLIITVGTLVLRNNQKSTPKTVTASTTEPTSKSPPKIAQPSTTVEQGTAYTNVALGIKLNYPSGWIIKDDSFTINGGTATVIRFSSPDYKSDGQGFSGTRFSIAPNSSHDTYSNDRAGALSNPGPRYSEVSGGKKVGGKDAFSYILTANETGFKSLEYEVNNSGSDSRLFTYESNDSQMSYSEKDLNTFQNFLNSVTFQ